MTKHTHVLLWIPLMYTALFFTFWLRIYQNEIIAFEEYVLDIQANYATDSATDELLIASDLNQDYSTGDYVSIEPTLAINDLAHTLCLDFGYIPTETNLDYVKNKNMRATLICAYDGVYAYYKMRTNTHDYELKQTPKMPYFYVDETDNYRKEYCLTLDPERGYVATLVADDDLEMSSFGKYANGDKPSEDLQTTAINNKVADLMNWALYETYNYGSSDIKLRIPNIDDTIRGAQPVKGPTVLAVLDGNRKVFSTYATAESIAGSQIEATDQTVAYVVKDLPIYEPFKNSNGTIYYGDDAILKWGNEFENNIRTTISGKYYAPASWWKSHSYSKNYLTDGKYFDSVFDAAKEGYNDITITDSIVNEDEFNM